MADVLTLCDGSTAILAGMKDMLELIDAHLGDAARRWLEEYLAGIAETEAYADHLEKEIEGLQDHHRMVLVSLREQAEIIAGLIREKAIDRKALSAAAGAIGTLTWQEL